MVSLAPSNLGVLAIYDGLMKMNDHMKLNLQQIVLEGLLARFVASSVSYDRSFSSDRHILPARQGSRVLMTPLLFEYSSGAPIKKGMLCNSFLIPFAEI